MRMSHMFATWPYLTRAASEAPPDTVGRNVFA